MSNIASDYKSLCDQFLGGGLSAKEFQENYLEFFKSEKRNLDAPLYDILDNLFGDVDSYTTDPELLHLKPDFYLDEARLRERVRDAAIALSSWR